VSGPVALVGFMGAGKSSVAACVADALRVPCVDTDAVIEGRHGSIAAIFAARGERAFREIERVVACEALSEAVERPAVVALGGGAVTIDDVGGGGAPPRLAHVVWIDAPLDLLFARASRAGGRPLARDRGAFEALYEERRPLYDLVATTTVQVSAGETVPAVAGRVIEALS
jgi:shikimate kinase